MTVRVSRPESSGPHRCDRRRRWTAGLTVLAILGALLSTVVVGPGTADAASGAALGPISGLGGRCVDVAAGGDRAGDAVQLWQCNGAPVQQWTVVSPAGAGALQALGRCLDAAGGRTDQGTPLQVADCTGSRTQAWRTGPDGSLVNQGSGLCLDASGSGTADGTPLVLWACNAQDNQRWTLPAGRPDGAPAHSVTYDRYSMMVDGRRLQVFSGEFHYWRLPSPGLWRDVLEKLRAGGYNAVSVYFDWDFHSPAPGVYDFTGVRDVDQLLTMASDLGMYVIARPGPYINAETDGGGFPGWLTTRPGRARSSEPGFQQAADEWLSAIDPIIARHQVTNGTGSVLLYQVENEYVFNTDAGYMAHLQQKARQDGITVPVSTNTCCGQEAKWASGLGASQVPGTDHYPVDCSGTSSWNPVVSPTRRREDSPVSTAEYQGGGIGGWGSAGYEPCRAATGPAFEKVFYKNNLARGATVQNFYMAYGGTNWGWLADPGVVDTSYDYGAAITEARQLGPKYEEVHRQGSLLQAVASLAKTDAAGSGTDNAALLATSRRNPDDGTAFTVVRHADADATTRDTGHVVLPSTAAPVDDTAAAITYTGTWTHDSGKDYTAADVNGTESYSQTVGDSFTATLTGTAVQWLGPRNVNGGTARVFLDGVDQGTVDTYAAAGKAYQQVLFQKAGLATGQHTLRVQLSGRNPAATAGFVAVDAVSAGSSLTVPQQAGTALSVDGRDSRLLLSNTALGQQRLVYSTSELFTALPIGGRDVAVLYGRPAEAGETALRYASRPTVSVLSGSVASTWDPGTGNLRLDYTHGGIARVLVTGGGTRDLLLLLTTDDTAATFWTPATAAGRVLVRGPELVRSAALDGTTLAVSGDAVAAGDLEVFGPGVSAVTWNGAPLASSATAGGSRTAAVAGPGAVSLPALSWRYQRESPEAAAGFADSGWTRATRTTTETTVKPAAGSSVLDADDYGFHHGDVWYRGHFAATGSETGLDLQVVTGNQGVALAWLNGTYLGTVPPDPARARRVPVPAGALRPGQDNVVSVLVRNMGHNEDFNSDDFVKQPRGLVSALLVGSAAAVGWRVQGNLGGERSPDTTRGPLNAGGLFGERTGWSLPGFADSTWSPVTLPNRDTTPGVAWYRSTFPLSLPAGRDVSVGLTVTDDPTRAYRALLFLNGWNVGQYINDVGPQHTFVLPAGLLRANGTNTLAIAVTSPGTASGGLGTVALTVLGNATSSLRVPEVTSPGVPGSGTATVVNVGANRCLSGTGTGAQDRIVLSDCTGAPAQQWSTAGGALRNVQFGQCAGIENAVTANGTRVLLDPCVGSVGQVWRPTGTALVNGRSGRCLDVVKSGTANGSPVQIWDCGSGKPNQTWSVRG